MKKDTNNAATKHTGLTVVSVGGRDVIDCTPCGFKHVFPALSDEELKKFYSDEFYQVEKGSYFKEAEEDKDWWMLTYAHYYSLLEAHTAGRRLLDVGSGPGYFLDAGKARGWDVVGVEPSPVAAQYARSRDLRVIEEMFPSEALKAEGLFDVIALHFVLEHIPEPAVFVAAARAMLKPGGLLLVVSPNDFNPLQKLLQERQGFSPWWVVPTHHANYFDIFSLPSFLAKSGFIVKHTETTYPVEFFLLGGRNYVGNPSLGRATHQERKTFESALYRGGSGLLQKMFLDWAAQGIGREAVVIAKNA